MADQHWGEAATRAAQARHRRQAGWILASAAAVWLLAPAVVGLVDGATGQPHGAHRTFSALASVVGAIAVAALGTRWYLRAVDEVERRVLIDAYAMFGAIMFFGFPIVNAASAVIRVPYLPTVLFIAALLAAATAREWRRWRG